MKPILSATIIVTALCLFISCKKDESVSPALASFRPKTYTENIKSDIMGNSVNTYDLTYDGGGRIISFIAETPGGLQTLYKYSDHSYTMDLYNGTTLSIHEIFYINSQSRVDSTLQYNNTNDTTTEKYLYNQSGQWITTKEYEYSSSGSILDDTYTNTYDNQGNGIMTTDDGSVTTYTFYTDLVNPLSLGNLYLPVNKYLVKTTNYTGQAGSAFITDTYTFDSNKRLTVDSAVADNGDIIVKTYTY